MDKAYLDRVFKYKNQAVQDQLEFIVSARFNKNLSIWQVRGGVFIPEEEGKEFFETYQPDPNHLGLESTQLLHLDALETLKSYLESSTKVDVGYFFPLENQLAHYISTNDKTKNLRAKTITRKLHPRDPAFSRINYTHGDKGLHRIGSLVAHNNLYKVDVQIIKQARFSDTGRYVLNRDMFIALLQDFQASHELTTQILPDKDFDNIFFISPKNLYKVNDFGNQRVLYKAKGIHSSPLSNYEHRLVDRFLNSD